jgi:hypothetical protein
LILVLRHMWDLPTVHPLIPAAATKLGTPAYLCYSTPDTWAPPTSAAMRAPCRGGLLHMGRAMRFIWDRTRFAASAEEHTKLVAPTRSPYCKYVHKQETNQAQSTTGHSPAQAAHIPQCRLQHKNTCMGASSKRIPRDAAGPVPALFPITGHSAQWGPPRQGGPSNVHMCAMDARHQ